MARSGRVAFFEHEIAERLSLPAPRSSSGISDRNRRPHHFRTGHAQDVSGFRASFRRKPADRSAEAMGGGGEHDSFGKPAFVEGFAFGPFARHHQDHGQRRTTEVARISAGTGQRLQAIRFADDDDLGELAIARAARPARHLEDVLHDSIRNRLSLELPNRPKAPQEISDLSGICHLGHGFTPA